MILVTGSMARSMKSEREYGQSRACRTPDGCVFCGLIENKSSEIISETGHYLIIKNIYGYEVWDGNGVGEHLMIVPRRHVGSLEELNTTERSDYMDALAEYESSGYSLYARSPTNKSRSVVHQYTHLMKIDNKPKKWLIFVRKPHILWSGR